MHPIQKPHEIDQEFPITSIDTVFRVRSLQQHVIDEISIRIQQEGFYPDSPIIVNLNGTYELISGNHRIESAKKAGLSHVPAIIYHNLTHDEKLRIARQANNNAETLAKTTFVDDAELIWRELQNTGMTQEKLAEAMGNGWSRVRVAQYKALQDITPEAWNLIVTILHTSVTVNQKADVTPNVTDVTFTEGLLRDILSLTSEQQLELVTDLADGTITKGKFKTRAKAYQTRNAILTFCQNRLGSLPNKYVQMYTTEVEKGAFDQEWCKATESLKKHEVPDIATIPKLQRLLEHIQSLHHQEESIQLLYGDFYEKVKTLGDESVHLILTDPPYNIAKDRVFDFTDANGHKTRSDISQDFGEWDKFEKAEFLKLFSLWASEFYRILKPQGSGYIFCADKYFSYLRDAFEETGFKIKTPLFWCKTNPGTQVIKTNFKSSVEMIFFFTKGESGHTFNWQGENEMRNWVEFPICGGSERIKDAKGETLHPTQKPEKLITHLIDISSNIGDILFDGFAGVGTVPSVAKKKARGCIAIEQDPLFFDAMNRRIADIDPQ